MHTAAAARSPDSASDAGAALTKRCDSISAVPTAVMVAQTGSQARRWTASAVTSGTQ